MHHPKVNKISTAVNESLTNARSPDAATGTVIPDRSTAAFKLSVGFLAVPIALFLTIFFFYPALRILMFSFMTQDSKGITGLPFTLSHYSHFFTVDLYMRVFWNTLRISLTTSLLAIVLGYPVAIVMLRSH